MKHIYSWILPGQYLMLILVLRRSYFVSGHRHYPISVIAGFWKVNSERICHILVFYSTAQTTYCRTRFVLCHYLNYYGGLGCDEHSRPAEPSIMLCCIMFHDCAMKISNTKATTIFVHNLLQLHNPIFSKQKVILLC